MEELEVIFTELRAPIKAFRIFAIEKAIKSGGSSALLEELKKCRISEDDPECVMLLDHAINSVEERFLQNGQGKRPAQNKISLAQFAALSPDEQLLVVKKTSTALFKSEDGVVGIKRLVQTAAHDVVKAEIVKKCWRFWPSDFVEFFEENLFARSVVLQLACLEAMAGVTPDKLLKYFDKLVLSRDPLIRAMAIRGLSKKYPVSAAEFLAESLRKGDYFSRLAALRVVSVMPFALNRASLLELLAHEHDQRLLKIAAAIVLANPDREIPFRLCDILERTSSVRAIFIKELQKNCCSMIRMADLCDDFQLYMRTLQKYSRRVRASLFVQNCVFRYESSQDTFTRKELVSLLREKCESVEVCEVVKNAMNSPGACELLKLASTPSSELLPLVSSSITDPKDRSKENNLLATLIHIRSKDALGAKELIETLFKDSSLSPAIAAAAFRTASFIGDSRWSEKALQMLCKDNEDLVAAALEYLAAFDNENFLLQIRKFIKSSSLIVRTALLGSLCRENPDNARDLLKSMLKDKDSRVREKAIASLIHFEFSGIRELLFAFLEHEKDVELIRAALSFYLANPMLENAYDLDTLSGNNLTCSKYAATALKTLVETLLELNMADEAEITAFVEKKRKAVQLTLGDGEKHETERLASLLPQINWSSISETITEISHYKLLKTLVFAGMLLLAVFFFIAGSDSPSAVAPAEVYNPVVSQIQDYSLIVQKTGLADGAILANTIGLEKIMAIPRPGKAFRVNPGDKIVIRALPFRMAPDNILIVKTIEVKKNQ